MLQSFRDNLKGTVAMFLVLLISIPFIFFGVDSLFTGDAQSGKAAEVNEDVVTENQLRRAISVQRDQLTQRFGDQLPADFLSDERLRTPALDNLINRQLRIQGAEAGRMTISDKALDELIVNAPAFQVDGKFDSQRFTYMVQSMGYTLAGYREMIRQEIIAAQYTSAVALSGFVTEQQLAQYVSLAEQARDFYWVTLPLAPVLEGTEVSDAEIETYYQENQDKFQVPERVSAKIIELNVADIAAGIEITDEQVEAQYQENMKSYETEPVRQAAHILVEAEDEAAAQAKLAEIETALAAGEDFAAVAARLSDDLGTRETGGDLGFTSGDTFPEEFETALAALEVGQYSAPVQTDAGYHVIKLVAVDQAEPPTLAEEAPMIRVALAESKAQQRFVEVLERLKEEAYNTDSIEDVAATLGLQVQTVPAFSRAGGQGLAADPRVVEAAFAADVLKDGHISPVLELDESSVAVVKVTEHLPAKVKPLAEVSDLISAQLAQQKAQDALAAKGEALLAELRTGADVETLAASQGVEWQISRDIKRDNDQYDATLLAHVFDMSLQGEQAAYSQAYVQSGDLVLVKLVKVEDGSLTALSAEERTALANRLRYEIAAAEVAAFEADLKAKAEIKVY
ncbi:SurA N-terminal domain-containing protein [Simiduia sp. 21SJ11W-1]|uniref:SurA N-terminal domain-containing protein n=1 Tax=Simiduia sp. 21SJ11W-1 TaxID=2909669 RepID=UPI00209E0980|nr:SurA N-terminal domain-containing protein [Simiduia sp. 21SJ11W-1]UTA46439.1 SurA N-terminal domain-containing protein [Simiduia sp. 21SJ11W-1]